MQRLQKSLRDVGSHKLQILSFVDAAGSDQCSECCSSDKEAFNFENKFEIPY